MIPLPVDNTLANCLSSLLLNHGVTDQKIKILNREPCIYASTFPTEIVKYEFENQQVSLFCKYLNGLGPNNFGHRGGVEYEARIYTKILQQSPLPTVKFYGTCCLEESKDLLMVLEYVEGATQLYRGTEKNVLEKAVRWIAGFHAHYESNFPSFLTVYNASYYHFWANKVEALTNSLGSKYYWLLRLCKYFKDNVKILTESALTCIHGEYYPKNILIKQNTIYPIDWESGAVAVGEIDLASIIEGSEEHASKEIEIYTTIRWPDGEYCRDEFKQRLLMSQVYYHLRWIGGAKQNRLNSHAKRFDIFKNLAIKLLTE